MSRTGRLFTLLGVLRARRMPVTAYELARELGVSQRSIYRDVETLRALGAPVEGQAGLGYCLGPGFFLPEFAFSPDELDALILGLDWVRQRADPALARGSESARAKILSARRTGSTTTGEPPSLVTAAAAPAFVDPPQAASLREAIRRQRKVAISYQDAHGAVSDRTVWPIAIVYFDAVRVLAAWCEHRSAFRHFRVDRLQVRTVCEERYPGRRQAIVARWRQQDRDWRSLLTGSDTPAGYLGTGAPRPRALPKDHSMVSLSPVALDAFLTQDDDAAIVMVNLLRFRPNGGRERYLQYLGMARPILARYGASLLFGGDGLPVLTAGQAQAWDAVVLVQYPRRAAFKALVADPEYQLAFKVGASSIADIVLQPVTPIGGLT